MKILCFLLVTFLFYSKSVASFFLTPPNAALLEYSSSLPQAAPIDDLTTNTFSFFINNTTGIVWDVDLSILINHSRISDLEAYLISPQGTTMTLTTRSSTLNIQSNILSHLIWDDQAPLPITDITVTNATTQPITIAPEGSMDGCFGENPQGAWQLKIVDTQMGVNGICSNATLTVTTLAGNHFSKSTTLLSTNLTSSTNLINVTNLAVNSFTIDATNLGPYLSQIKVQTWLKHTANSDLDIYLISPSGTIVPLSTDNGEENNDVFYGTVWDDHAKTLATDAVYTNEVAYETLVPEGSLTKFRGENPNGIWTLQIIDDTGQDDGALEAWSLTFNTLPGLITDVSGDHYTDIVTAKGKKIYTLQMINEAPQGAAFAGLIPKKTKAVAINEFSGDQQADLLLQDKNFLYIMAFSNSFLISNMITLSGDSIRPNYKVIATTDLNQDGLIDIISQNKSELGVTLAQKNEGVVSYQFKPLAIGQAGKFLAADQTNLIKRIKNELYYVPVIHEGSNIFKLGESALISQAFKPSFKISGTADFSPLEPGNELIIQRGITIAYGPTNVSRTVKFLYKGQGLGNIGKVIGPR